MFASDKELKWDDGRGKFTPIFSAETALISVADNYFGNDQAVFGEHSDFWREILLTGGGDLEWDTSTAGTFASELTWVAVSSGGYDAALSNINNKYVNRFSWHAANLTWDKTVKTDNGDIGLGLSGGRQEFVLGTGFILGTGGDDGGDRGDQWLGPHDVWRFAFQGRVELENQTFQIYQLTPNDDFYSHTHLVGADIAFHDDSWGTLAFGGLDILQSEIVERQKLHLYDIRYGYGPHNGKGVDFKAEYVWQRIGELNKNTYAWYSELGYTFDHAANTRLSYRFSNFSGEYDPLFPGGNDWGAWFIGEYLGEYILVNQNFQNHQVRLITEPTNAITLNVIYYFYRINNFGEGQFSTPVEPITDKNLTHEVDLILEYAMTEEITFKFINVYTIPERGAIQWSGGDKTISYFLGYFGYSF